MINTIQIKFNLQTRVFSIDEGQLEWFYGNSDDPTMTFYYGFLGEERNIVFNNLSFGIDIINDQEEIIFSRNWPDDGSIYLSSDQEFLQTFRIILKPNKTYVLKLWVNEGQQYQQFRYNLNIPSFEVFPDYEVE